MSTISALIVDDEELARENLAMLLDSFCPEIKVIGKASKKDEAIAQIKTLKPQLVFLDICMPSGVEGLDLLDEIDQKDFLVVFVTAFKDYAIKAFNANAIHYILKPIDIDDLLEAVKKVKERLGILQSSDENKRIYQDSISEVSTAIKNQEVTKITISHIKGIKIVNPEDIVYLQADGNCTQLFFKDGTKYMDTRTLKVYEDILSTKLFFRTHKSYIINWNFLKEFVTSEGNYALLMGNITVPVARSKAKEFREKLQNL